MASELVALRLRPEVLAALRDKLELPADASGPDTMRAAITHLIDVQPSQMVMPRGGYYPRRATSRGRNEAA